MPAQNSGPQQSPAKTPKRGGWLARVRGGLKRFPLLRLIYRFLFRLGIGQFLARWPVFFLFRALGMRVLKREDLRRAAAALRLTEYGEEEDIAGAEPRSAGPVSGRAREALRAYTLKIARPFTVEIPDVQLVGVTAIGFAHDGALIAETMPPYFRWQDTPNDVPAMTLIRSRMRPQNAPRVVRAFSLVNAWNNNYCMWLSECLARLEGLEDYERRTGHRVTVIIPADPPRYQTDSLRLMGYGPDRCLAWNGSRLAVGALVVSSFRRELRGDYHCRVSLAGLRWVRGKMLASLPPAAGGGAGFGPRVFISRRQALARRIANEDDVLRVLAPLGFSVHALEEMSFADQVRLFAQAEFIVAPHGAGLMNLAFANRPGVVELFGRHIQPSFSELARGFGFRYGFMECPAPRGDLRSWDADLVVDVPELARLVGRMLG